MYINPNVDFFCRIMCQNAYSIQCTCVFKTMYICIYIYILYIYIYYIRIYIYGLCESEFPDLNLSSSLSIWHMYEFVIQDIPNAPTVRTHLPHPLGGIFLPGDISFSQSFGSNPICGQTHLDLSTVRQLTRWTTLLLVGLLDKKESKTGLYIYIENHIVVHLWIWCLWQFSRSLGYNIKCMNQNICIQR